MAHGTDPRVRVKVMLAQRLCQCWQRSNVGTKVLLAQGNVDTSNVGTEVMLIQVMLIRNLMLTVLQGIGVYTFVVLYVVVSGFRFVLYVLYSCW